MHFSDFCRPIFFILMLSTLKNSFSKLSKLFSLTKFAVQLSDTYSTSLLLEYLVFNKSTIWRKSQHVSWYFSSVFILLNCLNSCSSEIFLIKACSFEITPSKIEIGCDFFTLTIWWVQNEVNIANWIFCFSPINQVFSLALIKY